MFLKTHKCGSSTVQNVFMRYGISQNLSFGIPLQDRGFNNKEKFMASMIPEELLPPDGKVEIFAVHSRLNVGEHRLVLHNDTSWITIVREPASVFESLYSFYDIKSWYGRDVTELKDIPMKKLKRFPRFGDIFGKNQMLFDLGYPEDMSEAQLHRAVEEIDRLFDLVLVAERMDESLVLLRHELCWSLRDVVVFAKNARRKAVRRPLDADTRRTLRDLNGADARLYDHFLAKHRRAVLAFGVGRMAREVSALRGLRDQFFEECDVYQVEGHNPFPKFREYSGLVGAYATDSDSQQCQMLSMSELALIDKARSRQRSSLENTSASQLIPG